MEVQLVMFREDGRRVDFPLTKPTTVIGRKEECDIRIPLAEVSRRHVSLLVSNSGVKVKDHGSANGTYVNNKRVSEARLSPGDHLIIGPVVFTVQINGQPEQIRQVRTKLKRRESEAITQESAVVSSASGSGVKLDDDVDPISALEALASSSEQTAIDPLDDEDFI